MGKKELYNLRLVRTDSLARLKEKPRYYKRSRGGRGEARGRTI